MATAPPPPTGATTHAGQHPDYFPYTEHHQPMDHAGPVVGHQMRELMGFDAQKQTPSTRNLLGTQAKRQVPLVPVDDEHAASQGHHQGLSTGCAGHSSASARDSRPADRTYDNAADNKGSRSQSQGPTGERAGHASAGEHGSTGRDRKAGGDSTLAVKSEDDFESK